MYHYTIAHAVLPLISKFNENIESPRLHSDCITDLKQTFERGMTLCRCSKPAFSQIISTQRMHIKASAYSFYYAAICYQIIFLSMHLLLCTNVMLDFISMGLSMLYET